MGKSPLTIYEVAKTAGVSIATVSRVLNDPGRVNEKTRDQVLRAVDLLGYVPKAEARAHAMQHNRRIGVITPSLTAAAFVQRLRGLAGVLRETNYELVFYIVDSTQKFYHYLETLPINHYLDGLIILSLQFDNRFAQSLIDHQLETVVVEYPHPLLNSVEIDDSSGGRLAADYLVGKGYDHFGFVGDTQVPQLDVGVHPVSQRFAGFRQRLSELNRPLFDQDVLVVPYDIEATFQAAKQYLPGLNPPKAIFAATDLQGIALIKAARLLGLKAPQDVAIIGFDDLDVADYVGMTTIRQHLDESGKIAGELLLNRIADPARPIQHIRLPLTLVERDTA